MRIAVVGLGRIGLPLAVQYAGKGHLVVGLDVDPDRVTDVNAGREPFPGEAELAERLSAAVAGQTFSATTDPAEAISAADAVVVVVPLFVDDRGAPDLTALDAATASIAGALEPGTLVVYETTLPVGTTRSRWRPALEAGSSLQEGRDFFLAFSPGRVLTGRVFQDLRRYPKLVGGLAAHGAERAIEFYRQVLDFDDRPDLSRPNGVWDLGSAEAAELAKLAETTYRDVNIGLVNQFARFAEERGIDIHAVIVAANSQPYSHLHSPGIAVGGHCIPVYPQLYLWSDPDATVVLSAREANAGMPTYAVARLAAAYGDRRGARVAVLGAAYRAGVRETAFSGVFPIVEALRSAGAQPVVHDPLFSADELRALGLSPYVLGSPVDAPVVQADHATHVNLDVQALPGAKVVLDGRGVLDPARWSETRLLRLGVPG